MSKKPIFFSFRRDDFFSFLVLSRGITELFPRGKAKVLESLGYLSLIILFIVYKGLGYLLFAILFIVCEGEAKILEGLGYSSIIVN